MGAIEQMFNFENRWARRNAKPPRCPAGKMNMGLVLPAVWEDIAEEGTLQLDLRG